MSRMRVLTGLIVLAAAAVLVPSSAALAATSLTANITCDARTGAITTSVSGSLLLPGEPALVTVEFQRKSGVRITPTTTLTIAPLSPPFRVTTTTTASGDIAAAGYTGSFPLSSLYYRQTLLATFIDATTGATYTTREATCDYDQRTTVSLTCDQAAHTVTATVAGIKGQAGSTAVAGHPTRVGYRSVQISQATANDPRFRGEMLGSGWDIQHRLTQATDGTWADTGFVHPITSNPYYYAEELTVGVFDANGTFVGSGSAACTLFDGSVPAS